MHESFWFGINLKDFLFHGFQITSTNGLIALCVALAILAIIYEGMKIIQMRLHRMNMTLMKTSNRQTSEHSSLLSRIYKRNDESNIIQHWSYWAKWFLEVTHWSFHTTLSYILMLAVMTFNGYVCLALVIGSGIGYWIFGPILIQMNLSQFINRSEINKCNPECSEPTTTSERRPSAVSLVAEQLVTNVNAEIH